MVFRRYLAENAKRLYRSGLVTHGMAMTKGSVSAPARPSIIAESDDPI